MGETAPAGVTTRPSGVLRLGVLALVVGGCGGEYRVLSPTNLRAMRALAEFQIYSRPPVDPPTRFT